MMEFRYPSYIDLDKAENIVKYSFVVHRSLTFLDLSVCEYSVFKGKRQGHPCRIDKTYPPLIDSSNNFISTEEDCRKSLTVERQLLYAHHLDSSARLDCSLRNVQECQKREYYSPSMFLSQVDIDFELYEDSLCDMITDTLKTSNQKVNFIRKLSNLMKKFDYLSNNYSIISLCLDTLHEHCDDSYIVKDFLSAFNFKSWIVHNNQPKLLQYLIHHANQAGYNAWGSNVPHELINRCISNQLCQNATILLKYYGAPEFSESLYKDTIHHLEKRRPLLSADVLSHPVTEGWLCKERNFLMLQVLDIFFRGPTSDSRTVLNQVWKSIPNPYISHEELSRAYQKVLSATDIKEIYEFYCEIIEEDTPSCKPRSLNHLCRTKLRKHLSDNRQLPKGIEKLCLPRTLQCFLKIDL